mmetsp:Transcript_30143/g.78937  ORF Transcript_30143/g.78937 Transcript_30143/m.78937 type:complete len:230 (+) Transcript_30143:1141-1830(+)
MQRRLVVVVLGRRQRPRAQQQAHALVPAVLHGDVQGRVARGAAGLQRDGDDALLHLLQGLLQRLRRLRRRGLVQQQRWGSEGVAQRLVARGVHGRLAGCVSHLRVGPRRDEEPHAGCALVHGAPAHGRGVQRPRAPQLVLSVGVRLRLDQRFHGVRAAPNGPYVQRRLAHPVAEARWASHPDQRLYGVRIVVPSGGQDGIERWVGHLAAAAPAAAAPPGLGRPHALTGP